MLKLIIENAQVVTCNKTTIKDRVKQEVTLTVNTTNGVELYQVEVWDDNIEKMNLQPNEVVTLHAGLISRRKDGRWYNTIRAYNAERGTATQAAVQVQTDEVF